jgi:hypothetical protein
MDYLDPFVDIIFAGIRAPAEEPVLFVRVPFKEVSKLEKYLGVVTCLQRMRIRWGKKKKPGDRPRERSRGNVED